MLSYYPPIKPYATYELPVTSPHVIYVEECGNPAGIPILFVHGGPGAGCTEDSRRFFNPEIYRIILFDQRGCGRSTPHAELAHNTTQELIQDIETIRRHLSIEQWILFGGSWGSTLSLVYAQTHPNRVSAMILRGIFLTHSQDMEWFFGWSGARLVYPDYWEDFIAPLPADQRHNIIISYYELLNDPNEIARLQAAKAWALWEARCATMQPNKAIIDFFTNPHTALSLSRIECHYFIHDAFLEHNQILRNMHLIEHIPSVIIHGRYDLICPLENAWQLHQRWPNSELQIIRDAGHAGSEPGILDALIRATNEMVTRLDKATV